MMGGGKGEGLTAAPLLGVGPRHDDVVERFHPLRGVKPLLLHAAAVDDVTAPRRWGCDEEREWRGKGRGAGVWGVGGGAGGWGERGWQETTRQAGRQGVRLAHEQSSTVMAVSAMFVARTIFRTPLGGRLKTLFCSSGGRRECSGSTHERWGSDANSRCDVSRARRRCREWPAVEMHRPRQ